MAICTTNLGLQHCRQDPYDPEAIRFGLQMLNRVIDLLGQFKLGGAQLRNDQGAPIRNDAGALMRVPWVIGPGEDLTGLWTGLVSGVLPPGVVVAWSGYETNIPAGWTLCDGTNGSPDLRYKFILGTSPEYPGATGGSTTHTHGTHSAPANHTDTLEHDDLSNHTDTLNIGVDPHTDTLDIGVDPHTDSLGHDGLIADHSDDILHTQPGDHKPHTHFMSAKGSAFDQLGGVNVRDLPADIPTFFGDKLVDNAAMEPIVWRDDTVGFTEEEDHPLTHNEIGHTAMMLRHYTDPHVLNLTHVVTGQALYLSHTVTGQSLDLEHDSISDHDLDLAHIFDGTHDSKNHLGPYMALCWIMKLAEAHQTFPNTPFS